ncbi:MAG: AAA family ATPase [Cyanobacteria bacterium SBLK]|nr:AAA family ATPase [Cyanobacteria bacterium SBLK]
MKLANYHETNTIYTGSRTRVYRAVHEGERQSVIIKVLRNPNPSFNELVRFRNQYVITCHLEHPTIVCPLALERCSNGYALVMSDEGAISLSDYWQQSPRDLKEFLKIAIQITESLHYLIQQRIIHKDIKPANILIHPHTKQIGLIDFSISSLLPKEQKQLTKPSFLEGTLAYISPEQTGRMNRGLDYRTDFYSLGVTFFELLTGKLPFESNDAMELIHCHIARKVTFLQTGDREKIPEMLRAIVLKLMAKNAENRYQSALGLHSDLEECLQQLETTGEITSFELGARDVCDRFLIPEKLYGREVEVQTLLDAFVRVASPEKNPIAESAEFSRDREECKGKSELVLVAGFSGIGKTAVVNEVHKPIVKQRGYFIKGKFDQFNRNIPFSAFVQAFRDLIEQLLEESDTELAVWKAKILEALGENGQVIIDAIPSLERIVDKQPPVPELSGNAALNRFNLVFGNFLRVFATREHPLVIFLDDLQWADSASLNLLNLLIGESETSYLLVLGAYRDNEVFPTHPLLLTLTELEKTQAIISTITLQPLTFHHINQLVAETLSCGQELARPLTELVTQKTRGNPFFTTQFLQGLYEDKLITFNRNLGYWECDLIKVRDVALTDDVVQFMVGRLQKLPEATQRALRLAACIGNQFELETLATICEKSQEEVAINLWSALQEGLILPISEAYKFFQGSIEETKDKSIIVSYRFLHDRVQQASYSLIREEDKQETHRVIGDLLLNNTPKEELELNIFNIANQLNMGRATITQPEEKEKFAELNLLAALKAKTSAAYEAALEYCCSGLDCLIPENWNNRYQLTLDIHLLAIELESLNTHFEKSEKLANETLKFTKNLLDRIAVYQMKIQSHIIQNDLLLAINTGLETLKLLDRDLLDSVNLEIDNLEIPNLESLSTFKKLNNPAKFAEVKLLATLLSPTYFIQPNLYPKVALAIIQSSVEDGYSSLSSIGYGFGAILFLKPEYIGQSSYIEKSYRAGQLSLRLLDRFPSKENESKLQLIFNVFIRPFNEHGKFSLVPLLRGFQSGLDTGDFEFACYCAQNYCNHLFFLGHNLGEIKELQKPYQDLITKLKVEVAIDFVGIWRQLVLNILGEAKEIDRLIGDSFDEVEKLPQFQESNNFMLLFSVHVTKSILLYLLENHVESLKESTFAAKYVDGELAGLLVSSHKFYYALASVSIYSEGNHQARDLAIVESNQDVLQRWAKRAPMNFQHKADLVQAEYYRVLDRPYEAMELYDRAIIGAKENEYTHEEALANELAAKFYLSRGQERIASGYMQDAYYCYARWGAKAKTDLLEQNYPELLAPILDRPQGETLTEMTVQTFTSTSTETSATLDLGTVIKASQALAGEIQLDRLLEQLINIAIENAGAQKGILILDRDNNWVIEAQQTLNSQQTSILQSLPIDSPDSHLSPAIVNSVIHHQQTIVLNDAVNEGKYTRDPYIIANQPKSVLCTPLINQGKLSGILYLENNSTANVFTRDPVELLQTLSAQAAIAIENARLYDQLEEYNRTLEQKVKERTAELSHTVEVLEKTQAELKLENALLKSDEQADAFDYQIGGSLNINAPTYVVRSADRHLYQAMRQGQFCYTFNARQMGKSSLMVRIMNELRKEGYRCISIDLTGVGGENTTADQWYKGIAVEMWRKFKLLRKFKLTPWWKELNDIPAPQRLKQFIEEVILTQITKEDSDEPAKIVIFVDEIDCCLSLDFPVNDFFALIRSCYNQRAIDPIYDRLTFALFGAAIPSTLITDPLKTPFNIGRPIHLEGFKVNEAQPLLYGLTVNNPQTILKAIIDWTGGQPFLTQKVCSLIRNAKTEIPMNGEEQWIADLVEENILKNWEAKDDPEHLKTVRDRVLKSDRRQELLGIYQQIILEGEASATYSETEKELLLSGLAIAREGKLRVNNRIYQSIFDRQWLDRQQSTQNSQ